MRFVFLYTEIAEYFLACCRELSKHGEVHIIRWPVNKEAPFQFGENKNLHIYNKADYTKEKLQNLIHSLNPNIIICSGWIDKDYLKITKRFYKKVPTVMTCDTHWRGTFKQQLARIISRFTLLKTFSHAWVPGDIQKKYVLKLGFKQNKIEKGFYSCDLSSFQTNYTSQKEKKELEFPKRFLYVGRYYDFKGINELWKSFIELQNEINSDWELWCLGTGDVTPIQHPKIKHFGFVQPKDLQSYIAQAGVFILPSRYEPWGVVVHEFAAAGFPLILSTQVGAKEQFLTEGKNGFLFEANNVSSLKSALKKIISCSDERLIEMGKYSFELSKSISPTIWTNSILKMAADK